MNGNQFLKLQELKNEYLKKYKTISKEKKLFFLFSLIQKTLLQLKIA